MWSLFKGRERMGGASLAAPIERAGLLVDTMLRSAEQDMGAVVRAFQKLAAEVDGLLALTAEIVCCVEEKCSRSILPMAHTLSTAAAQFIAERIESAAAIVDLLSNEAKMLENLSAMTRHQSSIAREVNALGIFTHIEVARLGMTGGRFEHMATELHEFAAMVSSGAEDVQCQTDRRRAALADRSRRLNESVERMRSQARTFEMELGAAIHSMEEAAAELMLVPAQFKDCVAEVGDKISRVVAAVQMQDITRQQAEHVRDALAGMLVGITARPRDSKDGSRAVVLRIQKMQLEHAHGSMQAWIQEIESCLESILRIGSSQVAGIGATILEQEGRLSAQLRQIEDLTREAKQSDTEIEQSMNGLDGLMQMVRAHLNRSEVARERMHLLNLNAIVEANHLGDRAAAVLEIASQISRISSGWSELTSCSSGAMEKMLHASSQAQETTRVAAQATRESLAEAQLQSRAGLATLKDAAGATVRNGELVSAAVSALHNGIADLSTLTLQLKKSFGHIGEALDEIESAQARWGEYTPGAPVSFDCGELERTCSAGYTTELERHVLRAALYGEIIPETEATATGNDVELF